MDKIGILILTGLVVFIFMAALSFLIVGIEFGFCLVGRCLDHKAKKKLKLLPPRPCDCVVCRAKGWYKEENVE